MSYRAGQGMKLLLMWYCRETITKLRLSYDNQAYRGCRWCFKVDTRNALFLNTIEEPTN